MNKNKRITQLIKALVISLIPSLAFSTDTSLQTTTSSALEEYSPESREYHLKAAFLRYVAKFVEWPSDALPKDTINICILGLVPSFDAMNSINAKVVNDRIINITKVDSPEQAKGYCQILFVTKTQEENVNKIIQVVKDQPILSFGDMDQFAEKGGAMNFYIANNRLAIMVNLPVIESAYLKINDRMMRLVTIVPPVMSSANLSPKP